MVKWVNRNPMRTMSFTLMIFLLTAGWGLFIAETGHAQSEPAPDEENCLICHRYPRLGRYDEKGSKRVYYINDQLFANSVHGKLRCKGCHVDLDKIPHEEVKKVDCATQCHIKEPSTNREFSHENMVETYQRSVHGTGGETEKRYAEDLPTCVYCHGNRLFNPYEGFWGKSDALAMETLTRCRGCHKDKNWTKTIYAHFTHRMRRRRSQSEIISLCTSCHEDAQKMARHGLEEISTFKDTFHWALVKYDVQNAPDCISCHVPVGYSTHTIRPRSDPASPLHQNNRVNTCSNQNGIQSCHPGASKGFAGGRVHSYGTKAQLLTAAITQPIDQSGEEPLLVVRAREEMSQKELFQYKVLYWIRLFYKFLIAAVIGFMTLHQLLDYRRARKEMHKKKQEVSHER